MAHGRYPLWFQHPPSPPPVAIAPPSPPRCRGCVTAVGWRRGGRGGVEGEGGGEGHDDPPRGPGRTAAACGRGKGGGQKKQKETGEKNCVYNTSRPGFILRGGSGPRAATGAKPSGARPLLPGGGGGRGPTHHPAGTTIGPWMGGIGTQGPKGAWGDLGHRQLNAVDWGLWVNDRLGKRNVKFSIFPGGQVRGTPGG